MMHRKFYTCCFIGHRDTQLNSSQINNFNTIIKNLIIKHNTTYFLFGSRSNFNDISYKLVSNLKKIYPHIRLIYIRAEYKNINKNYYNYLLSFFDNTYFPSQLNNSHKLIYIKRNYNMIDNSDVCIFHININNKNSGTKLAYAYAKKHNKLIITI